jgi:hypothetical protein
MYHGLWCTSRYLWPELVHGVIGGLEHVPQLADTAEEAVLLREHARRFLPAVPRALERRHVVHEPRDELLAREAVGVLAEERVADRAERELVARAPQQV